MFSVLTCVYLVCNRFLRHFWRLCSYYFIDSRERELNVGQVLWKRKTTYALKYSLLFVRFQIRSLSAFLQSSFTILYFRGGKQTDIWLMIHSIDTSYHVSKVFVRKKKTLALLFKSLHFRNKSSLIKCLTVKTFLQISSEKISAQISIDYALKKIFILTVFTSLNQNVKW